MSSDDLKAAMESELHYTLLGNLTKGKRYDESEMGVFIEQAFEEAIDWVHKECMIMQWEYINGQQYARATAPHTLQNIPFDK